MLSVIVSSTIVQIINKGSYHKKLLERQGFRLTDNKHSGILKSILVEAVMHDEPILINQNTPLSVIVSKFLDSPRRVIFTTDDSDKLIGVITESQIRPLITEYESLKKSIIASDITDMRVVTIKPNQDLDLALKLLTKTDLKELPVVSEEDKNKVIGFISRQDILNIYNRESIKYDLADGLSREIQTLNRTDVSRIADGYAIVEKDRV